VRPCQSPSGKPLYVLSFGNERTAQRNERHSRRPGGDGCPPLSAVAEASAFPDGVPTRCWLGIKCEGQFEGVPVRIYRSGVFRRQVLKPLWGTTGLPTEKDHSPKIYAHLERLRREEKEHALSYKFARVSSYLALDNLDEIIDEFDRANRCRNDIVHGNDFDESTFPTAKVRTWLGELVRLRMELEDPGQ